MPYRSVIIAPDTDLLLVEDEVQSVVNSMRAHMLRGYVTAADLSQKMQEEFEIVWFATHGDQNGVLLSDGHLDASSLTAMIRTAGAELVVLNTCSSFDVAMLVHNELMTHMICTIRPIPDREAFLTAKNLAFQLGRGLSYYDAYLAAKPGQNRTYLYLTGRRASGMTPARQNDDISPEFRRLFALIDGDEKWGQPGLMKTVASLQESVDKIKRQLSTVWIMVVAQIILNLALAIVAGTILYSVWNRP